ncbi:MAG: ABC transporter ATP-binding protein [Chlamydiales bacterium]
MKKLLEVKNLSVTFSIRKKEIHAVRNISFFLREGERLGIVGESGCGKSAAAKALVKLLPAHTSSLQGEILFDGTDLMTFNERKMRGIRGQKIGMIFQDPMTSLNPTLRVGSQIGEGFRRHYPAVTRQETERNVLEMLELVGISEPKEVANSYPHTLSGGMRQRVMIALALICKPKILLADEPTTSLDVTIQAQILELMQTLQKKTETSIILITHDLSVVAGFCDRVLVMYAGQIVEDAPVDKLFEQPEHPYTQRLLQSLPRLNMPKNHPLIPIEGNPPDLLSLAPGCPFWTRCTDAMHICRLKNPHSFSIAEDHFSFCWKHAERENQ